MTSNADRTRHSVDQIWQHGNLAILDDAVAPDAVIHDLPPGLPPSREGLRQFFAAFRTAFPDVRLTVGEQVVDGDRVATRWVATGTHTGPLMGIPATGRKTCTHGLIIERYRDGKVVELWSPWDGENMFAQLGLAPPLPGAEPPRATSPDENKRLYVRFVDQFFNQRNLAVLDELFHDGAIEHGVPPGLPPGRAGIRAFYTALIEAFPDLHFEVLEQYAVGDLVMNRTRMTGTNKGSMMGMPATGKRVDVVAGDEARIANGRCIEHRGYGFLQMMQQLGLAPMPQ
jgi:steroid delta-isomerase-like uncharacterized protein